MFDGIRTGRAAVDDRSLIQRLNISMPFSPTDGAVRYDLPLPTTLYNGLYITGKPQSQAPGRYWFPIRGSLIKAANKGIDNYDHKNPFDILYALDDLVTQLHINPFRTPLNGLELSVTVPAINPQQLCSSVVSYLNRPPNQSVIYRNGLALPYTEVEARQHKLKLYAPVPGRLRVEVKVNKMQFLGEPRPQMLADLVRPCYAGALRAKLLTAFKKIVWKCPGLDLNYLTDAERDLYRDGRLWEYWQVQRQHYATEQDFKRAEKQRERQKAVFIELVLRHWPVESPTHIERALRQQLNQYVHLIQTPLYEALLDVCLARWYHIGTIPTANRLPKHLHLPPLSEIYHLYFGIFPTESGYSQTNSQKRWLSANDLRDQPAKIAELLQGYKPRRSHSKRPAQTLEERAWKRQRNQASNRTNNILRQITSAFSPAKPLNFALSELTPLLSARAKTALALAGQSVETVQQTAHRQPKPVPLFDD